VMDLVSNTSSRNDWTSHGIACWISVATTWCEAGAQTVSVHRPAGRCARSRSRADMPFAPPQPVAAPAFRESGARTAPPRIMTIFHCTPSVPAAKQDSISGGQSEGTRPRWATWDMKMEHLAPFEGVLVAEFSAGHTWPKCYVAQTEWRCSGFRHRRRCDRGWMVPE
jgi:hypothetical protein